MKKKKQVLIATKSLYEGAPHVCSSLFLEEFLTLFNKNQPIGS
jgi:hypothetical protein